MDELRTRRLLISLCAVALVVRLAWAISQPAEPDARLGDQFEYLELGRNLIAHHELKFFDERFDQTVYAYRTPGYPLFVAACGGNVRVVRVVQAVIDTSTLLAVYLLGRRFMGGRGSLLAAAAVAFNPFLVYFSGLVLSETLFTALLAWGMYLLVRQRRPQASALMGMAVLAIAVLVRPSAMILAIVLAGAAVWREGWNAVVRNAAVAAIFVVLALFPWALRNAQHPVLRSWIWTTTNSGITTYDGFHDAATGASDQKEFIERLRPRIWRMDEVDRDLYLGQQAHEWIRSHPDRAVALMGNKILRTWSPAPLSSEYGGSPLYVWIGLLYGVPLDLLILLGLWKGDLPRTAKVFLLIPAIYFTGIHAASVGSLRYRVPVEPPMSVIVGSGAVALHTKYGPSRRKSG